MQQLTLHGVGTGMVVGGMLVGELWTGWRWGGWLPLVLKGTVQQ